MKNNLNKEEKPQYLKEYRELKELAILLFVDFESRLSHTLNVLYDDDFFELWIGMRDEKKVIIGSLDIRVTAYNHNASTGVETDYNNCVTADNYYQYFTNSELKILNQIINYKNGRE